MAFRLEVAFSELVAGIFTLSSELDGTDVLSDLGAFAGTYDDISDDVQGAIRVEAGTDSLASGMVLASTMTVDVARPDDAGYWNPNNPLSPLNSVTPGFVPIRPGRLIETNAVGTEFGVFYGFLRRAPWRATARGAQLYFEDLLFRLRRVFPVIASTGPTTTGAAIGLILDAAEWPYPEFRALSVGDVIDDFRADGSISARTLIDQLIAAERGTVFVRGDGVVVYESRDEIQTRVAAWTIGTETNLEEFESGIDADSIVTRAIVTRTDPAAVLPDVVWTSVDDEAERIFGRSENTSEVTSPYVPLAGGQDLADDLVYAGAHGTPPATANAFAIDDTTLTDILSTPLQSIVDVDDPLGGTEGEFIVQRSMHRLEHGQHWVDYTLTKRQARSFALDSELDGPDVFRY